MEEDIVEDLICRLKQSDEKEEYEQAIAIENLLKAYKELKEENLHWKGQYHLENRKYIDLHNKKIDIPTINATEEMLQQYIPKSKVKEKIEPVIDSLEKDGFVGYADEIRDILTELEEE